MKSTLYLSSFVLLFSAMPALASDDATSLEQGQFSGGAKLGFCILMLQQRRPLSILVVG